MTETEEKDQISGKAAADKNLNVEESKSNWAHDQKSKGYYYDDTCGYSVYDPESEDEDDREGAIKNNG